MVTGAKYLNPAVAGAYAVGFVQMTRMRLRRPLSMLVLGWLGVWRTRDLDWAATVKVLWASETVIIRGSL